MKYALTFFIFVCVSSIKVVSAREIQSFKSSQALMALSQFLYDVGEDLEFSIKISDKRIIIKDSALCSTTNSNDAIASAEKALMKVLRFYPDEELPFEQAMLDLEDYLEGGRLKKCLFVKETKQNIIHTIYYEDFSGKAHFRIDTIQFKSE